MQTDTRTHAPEPSLSLSLSLSLVVSDLDPRNRPFSKARIIDRNPSRAPSHHSSDADNDNKLETREPTFCF